MPDNKQCGAVSRRSPHPAVEAACVVRELLLVFQELLPAYVGGVDALMDGSPLFDGKPDPVRVARAFVRIDTGPTVSEGSSVGRVVEDAIDSVDRRTFPQ